MTEIHYCYCETKITYENITTTANTIVTKGALYQITVQYETMYILIFDFD